jgi:hypothetical protein
MVVSTFLNLIFIPVLYVLLSTLLTKFQWKRRRAEECAEEEIPESALSSH